MAFSEIDLTTRVGAHGAAANLGATGCFGFAVLAVLGLLLGAGFVGYDTPEGIAVTIAAGIEAVIGVIAGLRMKQGKGAIWGIAVGVLMVLEMAMKLVSLQIGAGLIINAVLLVCIVQGVRGALALRSNTMFEDDAVEAFE